MATLADTLERLAHALRQRVPEVAARLQPGLTRAEIDGCVARFDWTLPDEVYTLYEWRNGLSGATGKASLVDKLLRMKDRWHGELSGPTNELRVDYKGRVLTVKFMPLEYALAGFRHLKLGRCPLDLLPIFTVTEGKTKHYGMVQLAGSPEGGAHAGVVHCANGAKAPPWGITDAFLAAQPRFSSVGVLAEVLAQYATTTSHEMRSQPSAPVADEVACVIAAPLFDELRAQREG